MIADQYLRMEGTLEEVLRAVWGRGVEVVEGRPFRLIPYSRSWFRLRVF